MPVLMPTNIYAELTGLFVNGDEGLKIPAESVSSAALTYAGIKGEAHSGMTRLSCSRVKLQYKKGTEIRNTRQLSLVSEEELNDIAKAMSLPGGLNPSWLGANLVFAGIPDLTLVPPASRLIFESGASIVVDMENEPCRQPADLIETFYPGFGRLFVKNALHKRGLTAWVEREGLIKYGDKARLHIPPQRIYEPGQTRYNKKSAANDD